MIWDTNSINNQKAGMYKETVRNLEKAKELLDQRFAMKQISDSEYIKKSKEINAQIEKYKSMSGE